MKPRPKLKPRPESLISLLLIVLHFSCGLCRDLTHQYDIRHFINNHHSSHKHSEDLKNTAIMPQSDRKSHSDTSELYLIGTNSLGNHDVASRRDSDLNDDDASVTDYDEAETHQPDHYSEVDSVLTPSDVTGDVESNITSHNSGYNQESLLMDEREVWSLIDEVVAKRNRIRRQSASSVPSESTIQWRRKQKRRQRLLLKSRNKHLSNPQEGRKPHRNFILKSDSESHIITSASEVKKDWCRTVPFTHKVTAPHCTEKVVKNNFCYGQCNSFFIPQQRTAKGVAFQSYANCKPKRISWVNVTLDCPDLIPPVVQKTVLIVESCRCVAMDEPYDEILNRNIKHHTRHFKNRSRKRT